MTDDLPCNGCGKHFSISRLITGPHENCWVGGRGRSLWFCSEECHSKNFEKVFARLTGEASGDKLSSGTVPDVKAGIFEKLRILLKKVVLKWRRRT